MSCFAEHDKFACKHPVSFDQKFGLVTISLDWKWRNGLDNFICFSEILRRRLSKFDVDAAIRSIIWHVKDYVSTTLLTWQPNWPVTATALNNHLHVTTMPPPHDSKPEWQSTGTTKLSRNRFQILNPHQGPLLLTWFNLTLSMYSNYIHYKSLLKFGNG